MAKTLTVICDGQKQYGKQVDLKAVLAYFKFKLETRFTAEQVIYALAQYTDHHNDIPAPADVINILAPEPKKITQAEYIAAQKYQERNNYPQFSQQRDVIRDYESQESEAREPVSGFLLETVKNSVKRIT